MTQQYKVIGKNRDHSFAIGQIVTKAPADHELNVLGKQLAIIMRVEDDPEVQASAVFVSDDGDFNMMSPQDIEAI